MYPDDTDTAISTLASTNGRIQALNEVSSLLQLGLKREWTLREFGIAFVERLASPALHTFVDHARSE